MIRYGLALLGIVLFLAGCAKKSAATADQESIDLVTSAAGAVGAALGQSGSETGRIAEDERTACSDIAFGACSASVKERDFSTGGGDTGGCARGDSFTMFGKVLRTYDNVSCAFGTLHPRAYTRTTVNHYSVDSTGYTVMEYNDTQGTFGGVKTLTADDLKSYDGVTHQGGSTLSRNANQFTFHMAGVHRRGISSTGKDRFWHTLYTTTDIVSSYATDGTYTIASGTMNLTHNLLKYTASTTPTNVVYKSTCCYPTSGTQTIVATGSVNTTLTLVWGSTCGNLTINAIAVTLPSCDSGS